MEPTEVKVEENAEIVEATLAADSLKPAAKAVDDPKSKIGVIAQAIGAMNAMSKEDLVKWFNDTMSQFGPGKDHGVGDKSAQNQSSVDMHASAAQATVGPKTAYPMPKLDVKEDIEEMFVGQELSEEFKVKVSTLFEAAVTARVLSEQARLEEQFEEKLTEAVEEINSELTTKVDTYLDYVVEEWMKDNEVAIESTLRNELTTEFIEGMKKLFAEHYVDVPQDKVDVIESLADKVEELEEKLNEQINENAQLKNSFVEVERKEVLDTYTNDLPLSSQEKFKKLAEGVDFDGNIETYSKKLAIIKENYFSERKPAPSSTNIEEETFEGEESPKTVAIDPTVSRYVQAIAKTVKK